MTKWKVHVPAGRWMGGEVHTFPTKRAAMSFMERWNIVEVNSGNSSLTWRRLADNTYRGEA